MALALNNLKRVDMPLNKETKPNHNTRIKKKDISQEYAVCPKILTEEN